jgi:hypothetical protein
LITLIEARTAQGTLLSLPLEDVSSGLIVKEITGLDPVKATIVSSPFASMPGAQYQSSQRETRNITMKLGLSPDYLTNSVRELRKTLYNFFMPQSPISLRFYDSDGLTVDISGRVESFDSPLFVSEPEAVLSILCFDPDFTDITAVVLSGSTVASTTSNLYQYDGEVETGFTLVLNVNRTLTEFTLYNKPADNVTRTLDVAASLVSGDVVTISTIAGAKSVKLTRSGITSSLLYGMTTQSSWIEFFPGDNHFRVYATGAAIPYTVTYTTRYGGL